MILILTDQYDVHADIVLSKVKYEFFRLNLDVDSLKKTKLTFLNSKWVIEQNGKSICSNDIRCVWPRRVTVQITLENQSDNDNGFRLWRSEWNKSLFGFYNAISDANWLNSIRNATLADNKYYQAIIAEKVGFRYPEFVTSNNKEVLSDFLLSHPESVVKFMSQDMYSSDSGELLGLYVNKITENQLSKFADEDENPITIQCYINKLFEVRYTVVDGAHFACAIDSQSSLKAKIDWRRYDIPGTPHRRINIPDFIKNKVSLLMEYLNLKFGALDFIVDENNDWWFLEINSSGQWLWIEDLSGLDISGSIANWLNSNVR